MKYIFIVISFFALICNLHAQSIVHLCVGDADKNFSVPYHIGSSYTWTIVDNSNIAVISSGNGTEHIKIDLNNTGMFKLKVEPNIPETPKITTFFFCIYTVYLIYLSM